MPTVQPLTQATAAFSFHVSSPQTSSALDPQPFVLDIYVFCYCLVLIAFNKLPVQMSSNRTLELARGILRPSNYVRMSIS